MQRRFYARKFQKPLWKYQIEKDIEMSEDNHFITRPKLLKITVIMMFQDLFI